MPQGYIASGNAYTCKYDEIRHSSQRKVIWPQHKIYLLSYIWVLINLCKKWNCSQWKKDLILPICSSVWRPSKNVLKAITNFSIPKNITDAWSWFGFSHPSSMGIFIKPHNVSLTRPHQTKYTLHLEERSWEHQTNKL